ncbi:MAG TPA: hypothetical protein VMM92_05310, partial [Thermoanaerobaculia bacterium]|nr:hypothetical protein [Thermoanaerobaculia bacterium]
SAFFTALAKDAPRGDYPRYLTGEQAYWTVVGVDGGADNGLLDEDGRLEAGKGAFSIEPFLYKPEDGSLLRWSDVTATPALVQGDLPIPQVTWERPDLRLEITSLATGKPEAPVLYLRYRLENRGAKPQQTRLFLALRPFQVDPPWQFLNDPGGVSPIRELAWDGRVVTVNGGRTVVPVSRPDAFGAAAFESGDITRFARRGEVPGAAKVADPLGFASGALAYDVKLPPAGERSVYLALPLGSGPGNAANAANAANATNAANAAGLPTGLDEPAAQRRFDELLARTSASWRQALDRVGIALPPAAADLVCTQKTALAHLLVERQGPALRPGTRSYARSWIRDGALMAAALLRLGHAQPVREFLLWYAGYLFPDGKVPCCVDSRGADPVPENDSHGEFLFLVAEDYRFEHDRELLTRVWPQVEAAAGAIEALRASERRPEDRTPERRLFYGLLPASISHEGYSAKPMHSYWDDFFALRGLKDAAYLAAALGKTDLARRWGASRDELRADILASLQLSMARHGIDYLPGAAELGDFDATSTTIALSPVGELQQLPRKAVERTFERYWENFVKRRDGVEPWDAYTPYELRAVGTFVRLGWRARAQELLAFFLADRRPQAWNQWPEVVWHDPRAPKFLGDLPHAWVGSDYLRSFLDLFVYEREADQELVLGAGIPEVWVRSPEGVSVRGLATPYGPLTYQMSARKSAGRESVRLRIEGGVDLPLGGLAISWPLKGSPSSASVNGKPVPVPHGGELVLHTLPAEVVLRR